MGILWAHMGSIGCIVFTYSRFQHTTSTAVDYSFASATAVFSVKQNWRDMPGERQFLPMLISSQAPSCRISCPIYLVPIAVLAIMYAYKRYMRCAAVNGPFSSVVKSEH